MKKAIALVMFAISLVACSSMPMATKVAPDQATGFFSSGKDTTNGTVYFVCGRQTVATVLMSHQADSPSCQYSVNGTNYKGLEKGSVGRLDLKPGTYQISQPTPSSSSIMSVPLKLELRAGEIVLVKAHFDMKTGLLGGGASAVSVFTVDYDKEDALKKVKSRQPMLMEPAPEAK